MTFLEFAYLEPIAPVMYRGAPAMYVKAARHHPMASTLAQMSGLPIEAAPVISVMGRLRRAYRDYRAWTDDHMDIRELTDEEILQRETAPEPYAYFRAVLQFPDGSVAEAHPSELRHPGEA